MADGRRITYSQELDPYRRGRRSASDVSAEYHRPQIAHREQERRGVNGDVSVRAATEPIPVRDGRSSDRANTGHDGGPIQNRCVILVPQSAWPRSAMVDAE